MKHTICHQPIAINISSIMNVYSFPSISGDNKGTLVFSQLYFALKPDAEMAFRCVECDSDVPKEEIICMCYFCRNHFPLNETYIYAGQLCCKECGDNMHGHIVKFDPKVR